jgi:fucose 4-O-acetylase-like acetyltransferase
MRLDELAAGTPASRDRYVDFLRAASITVVVLGHWLSAVVGWKDGALSVRNAVGLVPGLWCTTWLLQVMPVFFFIGGFSNFTSVESTLRRGETMTSFLRSRLVRLLKPTAVFLGVWLVVLVCLHLAGVLKPAHVRSTVLLFGPLWFLVVYLVITALTPVMRSLHLRFGIAAVAVMALAAVGMDVLRFSVKVPAVGWANMAFVWLLAHQLGFFYADGTLARARRRVHLAIALGGLAGLLLLTHNGVYPKSMVGTGFERISNMSPPTVCILLLTVWLVGAVMYLRGWVNRWLARPGPWKAVIAANSVIMTIYLWHITAYAVVFGVLALVGFPGSTPGSAGWWLERPIWLAGPAAVLVLLIVMFSRFERPTLRPRAAAR